MTVLKILRMHWDRSLGVTFAVAGAILLIVGWFGVSGNPYVDQEIPYLVSGGLGGIFLLGLGAALWLSADLRDEWTKLDDLQRSAMQSLSERTTDEFDYDGVGEDEAGYRGPDPDRTDDPYDDGSFYDPTGEFAPAGVAPRRGSGRKAASTATGNGRSGTDRPRTQAEHRDEGRAKALPGRASSPKSSARPAGSTSRTAPRRSGGAGA